MTQHTKGPWEVMWEDHANVIIGADQAVIADCFHADDRTQGPREQEQALANARLIASAPELLEALNHAHNSLRTFRNVPKEEQEWTSFDDDVMEAIERAIAKAEGRG